MPANNVQSSRKKADVWAAFDRIPASRMGTIAEQLLDLEDDYAMIQALVQSMEQEQSLLGKRKRVVDDDDVQGFHQGL
jgi:hypothetical protein